MSTLKWFRNIVIVWFLTGFWHGASWNYVLWGLYFGLILIVEKKFFSKNILNISWLSHIYTVFLFLMGWVIFRIESTKLIPIFFGNLFDITNMGTLDLLVSEAVLQYIILIILGMIGATPLLKTLFDFIEEKGNTLLKIGYDLYLILIFVYSVMLLISDTFNPFIYFRF